MPVFEEAEEMIRVIADSVTDLQTRVASLENSLSSSEPAPPAVLSIEPPVEPNPPGPNASGEVIEEHIETLMVEQSNHRIYIDPTTGSIGTLWFAPGVSRVLVSSVYEDTRARVGYVRGEGIDALSDLTFSHLDIDNRTGAAFNFFNTGARSWRILLNNIRTQVDTYSAYFRNVDDLIIRNCDFTSLTGNSEQSNVRLESVNRVLVENNFLTNFMRHNFRVHGNSSNVTVRSNELLGQWCMFGSMPGDVCDKIHFHNNIMRMNRGTHYMSLASGPDSGDLLDFLYENNTHHGMEEMLWESHTVQQMNPEYIYANRNPRWRFNGNTVES